ncbi:MAG TPA: DUF1932 domain-containing protein [Micromonosporaceae bacterium]|nr:DUF1932 domain-containing protein [Micromonosporaceae bacterium]
MTVVGVVSPGHMGSGLGGALRDGGARVVATVRGRSRRTERLAAGLELLPTLDDVVAAADVVLVVTPPGEALAAARSVAAAARRTGVSPLVADLNAVSPPTMVAVSEALAPLDVVDGSISGPPPSVRPGATVYLSGPRAADVAALPWTGVRPTIVGAAVGAASAVKMCTASVQKGVWALVGHAIATAAANGVLEPVLADVGSFLRVGDLARPVASGATKAHRYVAEMREIAATQRAAGLPGELFDGFAAAYQALSGTALADGDPEGVGTITVEEVVRLMGVRTAGSAAGG